MEKGRFLTADASPGDPWPSGDIGLPGQETATRWSLRGAERGDAQVHSGRTQEFPGDPYRYYACIPYVLPRAEIPTDGSEFGRRSDRGCAGTRRAGVLRLLCSTGGMPPAARTSG